MGGAARLWHRVPSSLAIHSSTLVSLHHPATRRMSEEVIGLPRQALWFITLLRTGTITAGGLTILSWTQLLLPVAIDVAVRRRV